MVGTVMDAEDLVQDTYLRWQTATLADIRSPQAWLTTAITRLCINHLQSARVQRESYVGPWLPEPLLEQRHSEPDQNGALADSLSFAFLLLLETLTPTERAVFILREAFEYEFAEIATVVEKSEANCRQILTRARKRLDERRPRYDASEADAEKLVPSFLAAVRNGDLNALLEAMANDVVLIADGGGKATAVPRPVHGPEPIAKLLINLSRRYQNAAEEIHRAIVNGLPGFVSFLDKVPRRVVAFGVQGGRINALFVITNPDKLRHIAYPAK